MRMFIVFSCFMKNFFLVQKYFGLATPERSQSPAKKPETPRKNNIDAMLERFPKNEADKLRALNLSEEQLKARLAALVKLDSYINDDTKFSRGNAEA